MMLLSYTVDGLMGEGKLPPNVFLLTVFFLVLHFLAATQDIAVDGWALTMLSRENVGYASTCNSVGQTAGFFLGYTIFLALESKDFCNTYLRLEPEETGMVELSTFLYYWGVIFVVVTTAVWLFKSEKREGHAEERKTVVEGKDLSLHDGFCLGWKSSMCGGCGMMSCRFEGDSVLGRNIVLGPSVFWEGGWGHF